MLQILEFPATRTSGSRLALAPMASDLKRIWQNKTSNLLQTASKNYGMSRKVVQGPADTSSTALDSGNEALLSRLAYESKRASALLFSNLLDPIRLHKIMRYLARKEAERICAEDVGLSMIMAAEDALSDAF